MALRNPNTLAFEFIAKDKASKSFDRMSTRADRFGHKIGRIAKRTAQAATIMGVAFGVHAAKQFLSFDDAMTESLAIMGEISGPMRDKMERAARQVGKTTRFSAQEAAQSYFFLASAGLDAQTSLGAMPVVAKFAQAGMFDLARATDLGTDAQSALGLKVKDSDQNIQNLTRVTDVFTKANTLANATVEQFATSMTRKAGGALRNLNKSVEEGTAVLAVFADQGIKSRRAGTILRATLDGLSDQSRKNAKEFKKYNVTVFDSNGEMRNMADIVEDLEVAFKDMSIQEREAALAKLGFNKRSREGMLALIGNSDELRRFEEELRKAGGTTKEVADKQLQSFQARLELMKAQIDDVAIVVGEKLVNAFFDLGAAVKPVATNIKNSFQESIIPAIKSGWEEVSNVLFDQPQKVGLGGVIIPESSGLLSSARRAAEDYLDAFKERLLGKPAHVGLGGVVIPETHGIVDSITTAFKEKDFGPVGEAIGRAIGDSLFVAGDLAGRFLTWVGSVDWVGLGIKAGGLVIPFALGLVAGLVNSLTDPDMWKMLGPHWQELLFAAIAFAFAPVKVVTAVANILRRIPLVGRLLAWLVESFASLSRKIVRPVLNFLGRMFGAFIQGLTGGAAGRALVAFANWLRLLPTRIGVAALEVSAAATRLMFRLGEAILGFAGRVGRWIGTVIGWLTKPFRTAGGWLVGWGKQLIQGLISGIVALARAVGGAIAKVIGWVTKPFRTAGSWLFNNGKKLIGGLKDGIINIAKTISSWVGRHVIDPIKRIFTSRSPTELFKAGTEMVRGHQRGIMSIARNIGRWLGRNVISRIRGAFDRARDWLVNAGKNTIRGLKSGMLSLLSRPRDWFKSVGNKIVSGVKKFFGISSPSKVFAGFGRHLVTGLIKGMITSGKGLTAVVKQVFGSMPKALGHLVKQGVLNVAELPGKALDALGSLGGSILDFLFGSDSSGAASKAAGRFAGLIMPPGAFSVGRGSQAHGYLARDLPAPTGTPVFAPFSGNVSARSVIGSYGNHVRLAGAGLEFLAAHLSAFGKLGKVNKGDLIGYVGSTGNSTGPHLHVEMRSGGRRINPDVLPGFARGGFGRAGQWAWVGENGPELMRMPMGARIFNNRESERMDEGNGGRGDIIIKDGGSLIGEVKTVNGNFSLRKIQDDIRFRGLR